MSDLKTCPRCGGEAVECRLYYVRHEMCCASCGLVEQADSFDGAAGKWRKP
jgi:transcription initiation factor TFIIIB Brf1 subunit/transcription initiation factor TFIIB